MIQSITAAVRRIRIRRIVLIFVLALVFLLLAGFALRKTIPAAWVQRIQVNPASLPAIVSQISQRWQSASPTAVVTTMPASMNMPGMDSASVAAETSSFTATTTASPQTASGSAGVVTVITMTPTGVGSIELTKTNTTAITVPATVTPISPAIQQPTSTLPGDATASTITPEGTGSGLSPDMAKIKTDILDLYQIMQVSRAMMQTFQHGQPTEAELAAIQAQLTVVDQRMGKLVTALQTIPPGTETFGPDARISPEHVRQLIELMRWAVEQVKTALSGSSIDSATLVQAQTLIEQLQGMMGQIQSLLLSAASANQPTGVPATPTPVFIPSPTFPPVPTATPAPSTFIKGEFSQLQVMLGQMQELLRQMQGMLEQMQNQPGMSALQSMNPGGNDGLVPTPTPGAPTLAVP